MTDTSTLAELAQLTDPGAVFRKLVREVDAGKVLVSMASTPCESRLAALDSLRLARDVLADGLAALTPERVDRCVDEHLAVDQLDGARRCARCGVEL